MQEPRAKNVMCSELRSQHLKGYDIAQPWVLRLEDNAHATAADYCTQPVDRKFIPHQGQRRHGPLQTFTLGSRLAGCSSMADWRVGRCQDHRWRAPPAQATTTPSRLAMRRCLHPVTHIPPRAPELVNYRSVSPA